ncbi:anthranilate synthase family protein [Dactylosporangium sp. McL0621]|uniref:anthranilate synthase family protein n=1 Tax=Dactylosporangium sp. McL0621 TaxID=3415678 RepID=UPI003CF131DA
MHTSLTQSDHPDAAPPFTLPGRFDVNAPFALLRREGRANVEVLTGPISTVDALADIPDDCLALVPFRQVRERGFDCVDDGTPLSVLHIADRQEIPVADLLNLLPESPIQFANAGFDVGDDEYASIVDTVLREEIGRGEGSNFVIHRVFEADMKGSPVAAALTVFRRLLTHERGAYWTFVVHTGDRTLVGATPERHVSVDDGLVMMNPISGTLRGTPSKPAVLEFLADRKEIDELSMVLDEELKMMATVADLGGQVIGPYLKEMTHLVHTEYLLAGRTTRDVREVLRETMFAPTVVGSPIENACRVVARHEHRGRGYYGAVLALLGRDAQGRQTLDAPILIRTADIDNTGRLRVPVGATLVRHSTPAGEVLETHTKAAAVLRALGLGAHTSKVPSPTTTNVPTEPKDERANVSEGAADVPVPSKDEHSDGSGGATEVRTPGENERADVSEGVADVPVPSKDERPNGSGGATDVRGSGGATDVRTPGENERWDVSEGVADVPAPSKDERPNGSGDATDVRTPGENERSDVSEARLAAGPEVQAALVARNATLAPFWLQARDGLSADPALAGRRALVVDAEDTFTGMLVHQLRVLGLSTTLVRYDSEITVDEFDLVIPGPGPGDPRQLDDQKIARMRGIVAGLLQTGRPMLAICLSHQLTAGLLGLPLRRKASPYQGMQREIDLFGRQARVGFYSTFAATHHGPLLDTAYGPVNVARDPSNGDVHALRGRSFASLQFHPESVLSQNGIDLVRELLTVLLATPVASSPE